MKCPACSNMENKVIDSRLNKEGDIIRRRRECLNCGERFTTYERVERALPYVIKKDGRREEFNRDKILEGVKKACQKRSISIEQIEGLV
ncbi:MAG: transcriptional repressor NrdR, partial [Nitrospinaceae bacterium]|nr:transcriptional repressor NrdR [Nitrospinaceae bacterium]NIR55013.1 transcriptional repressor NrdR [Nitrospinaceae bacterium]NIS85412.1 transcriptional repressor NrdR [Nitrospinaceae bacterium]NIT82251.1 transcriptional repressor NrdR [Nitrospinaceae bacterium]NIU44481.1 transcriptional repressor NrdR [Nitrospinaceae bacterium]